MKLHSILCLNLVAFAAILPYRIVAGTATDDVVAQSALATSKHVGVSGQIGAAAANERLDIHLQGTVTVEYGGNVAFGDALTSDASGRAIVATVGSRIIGVAAENGSVGVLGSVVLSPGFGPAA